MLSSYNLLTLQQVLKPNKRQFELAKKLDRLSSLVQTYHHQRVDYANLLLAYNLEKSKKNTNDDKTPNELLAPIPPRIHRGLFIQGKVGTGKSMMLNLFLESLPPPITRHREHFHSFLQRIHLHLHHERQKKQHPGSFHILQNFGTQLGSQYSLFALDEFLQPDEGTNMLLQPVLESLMRHSVLVCTSNVHFLPEYLQSHVRMFDMEHQEDYRLGNGQFGPSLVLSPPHSLIAFLHSHLSCQQMEQGFLRCLDPRVVACDFFTLFSCEQMGVKEYESLLRSVDVMVLEKANFTSKDQLFRFCLFLDLAYELGVQLVISTDSLDFFSQENKYLGQEEQLHLAWKRARSRWMEMSQEPLPSFFSGLNRGDKPKN